MLIIVVVLRRMVCVYGRFDVISLCLVFSFILKYDLELKLILEKLGQESNLERINELFAQLDVDGGGSVSFSEFVSRAPKVLYNAGDKATGYHVDDNWIKQQTKVEKLLEFVKRFCF
jgi:hypothetical protein